MLYGNNLKELREEKGLNQVEIGKVLDIKGGVYSLYETEYTIIPSKHLMVLCDLFSVSLDYLFEFTDFRKYQSVNKNPDIKISGQRLKEIRKENKLTQEKLAKELNTTQSVIADYERGRYLIATPFLYQVCKTYHISADYLLDRIDNPKYFK